MINLRNKSVNVDTKVILQELKKNLKIHTDEYLEAVADYQQAIILKLKEAASAAAKGVDEALKVRVTFNPPSDHRKDFVEAIELLEYSVDKVINLDHESFKAYIKNEWSWSGSFRTEMAMTKAYVASASLGGAGF